MVSVYWTIERKCKTVFNSMKDAEHKYNNVLLRDNLSLANVDTFVRIRISFELGSTAM